MSERTQNVFTESLSRICAERLLDEKWLVAPSLRVGHQWLECVVRAGRPAVNVRVQTLKGIALELAAPEIAAAGATLVSNRHGEILIDRIWSGPHDEKSSYIGTQQQSFALSQTIFATINALRTAGVEPPDVKPAEFEVGAKGKELAAVYREYIEMLKEEKLTDYPEVLRMATDRLRKNNKTLSNDMVVLLPEDLDLHEMEKRFVDSIPTEKLVRLPADEPGKLPEKNNVKIFSAAGEVNEAREMLRRCMAGGTSLDEVELLHTDAETYVPLIYETLVRHLGEPEKNIPATFAEGIPVRYSRPGRALAAWLEWMREGYPQTTLVRMIQDGLVEIEGVKEDETSFTGLADILRSVPIMQGRGRHLEKIDGRLTALKKRASIAKNQTEDSRKTPDAKKQFKELKLIRTLVEKLLGISPAIGANPLDLLQHAEALVENFARSANEIDNYSRIALLSNIRSLKSFLEPGAHISLDVREWLEETLPNDVRVLGSGPRPGCLHVANIHSGGHSGRPLTFIAGLDDSRFPGAPAQDPLLLDSERKKLSPSLRTSAEQLRKRTDDFARLLARLRGSVTLSYSRRSLQDDREIFPSPALLDTYRKISGKTDSDLEEFTSSLPAPASFAPADEESCIDEAEWWLWQLCGGEVDNAENLVLKQFPSLKRGNFASAQRQSDEFTSYDGRVEQAGKDHDPAAPDGPAMSASRLETLGRCPMAYFFRYILKLEPPEEAAVDPSVWLDPLAAGSLLHEVFEQFMRKMIDENRTPEFLKDFDLLIKILDRRVKNYKAELPPPNENAFKRQYNGFIEAARIFLTEEEIHSKTSRPAFLEACIGLRSDEPTELDSPEPVEIKLPNGKTIRARGIIDRVDLTGEKPPAYSIWDYKTGSAWGYSEFDPFRQGRRVQHCIYLMLVRARLKEIVPKAKVDLFGFFFPGVKARGERLAWTPKQLAGGDIVLQRLCEMAASGCFPHTDNPDDCAFCDFAPVCRDLDAVTAASQRKLSNAANKSLKSFRDLRQYEI